MVFMIKSIGNSDLYGEVSAVTALLGGAAFFAKDLARENVPSQAERSQRTCSKK
jgi:hypothetical protein